MTDVFRRTAAGEGWGDPFAFGDADMQRQALRNLFVLATLPWTAAFALAAEFASLDIRRKD